VAVGPEELAEPGVGDLDRASAGELDRDGLLELAEARGGAVDAHDALAAALDRSEADLAGGEVAERAGLGKVADVAIDGAAADLEREVGAAGRREADLARALEESGDLLAADAE